MVVEPLDLVALVNDWGTQPRAVGHREAPGADAEKTAVADRVHAVFAEGDPDQRAAAVTAMLAETEVRPEMAVAEGGLVAVWRVPRAADALLASAALALRDHLAEHPDRLGICADRQCADVYLDVSPAGRRRFCSLTCQNRARVAAFRARRQATGS
ncbi:CGNR zinc finger domain-containing protein [Actinoplanes sp. NPDC051633]|uniref:CGNR zinc finger domain-containing protein n=1 Tax=Actinoplanes sp. NPDC051633 TaxID=3155670 RepID=UPI003431E7E9